MIGPWVSLVTTCPRGEGGVGGGGEEEIGVCVCGVGGERRLVGVYGGGGEEEIGVCVWGRGGGEKIGVCVWGRGVGGREGGLGRNSGGSPTTLVTVESAADRAGAHFNFKRTSPGNRLPPPPLLYSSLAFVARPYKHDVLSCPTTVTLGVPWSPSSPPPPIPIPYLPLLPTSHPYHPSQPPPSVSSAKAAWLR